MKDKKQGTRPEKHTLNYEDVVATLTSLYFQFPPFDRNRWAILVHPWTYFNLSVLDCLRIYRNLLYENEWSWLRKKLWPRLTKWERIEALILSEQLSHFDSIPPVQEDEDEEDDS